MEAKKGIWRVSSGKGNRMYINCSDDDRISHPEELSRTNGLLVYGFEQLKDLAIAILLYEKKVQHQESILGQLETDED